MVINNRLNRKKINTFLFGEPLLRIKREKVFVQLDEKVHVEKREKDKFLRLKSFRNHNHVLCH